jgi:ATP-dependent 26S proteasome regulatory subunit
MRLAPAQRQAMDALLAIAKPGCVVALSADYGTGRTAILREAHATLGGAFLGAKDLEKSMEQPGRHPLSLEESFHQNVARALDSSDVVFVDDLHLLASVVLGCHSYPRSNYVMNVLHALSERVEESQKTLVLGTAEHTGIFWRAPGGSVSLGELQPRDYRAICDEYLAPVVADAIDFERVHRHARRVSARMLRLTCEALCDDMSLDADRFVDHLRTHHLVSNIDLDEVQAVDLRELRGLEDLVEQLEANIIMPLENAELAGRLGLKPKRGVLIAGPPGTGKTTIGRALAHRLKSKFFLVDGNFIAGTPHFFQQVHHVFMEARRNAPAIVFIDDSDVIFESGEELGLYRYLLTMLDGLESRSVGAICLMMTAMDVSSLPPALVRSGRIELWLETTLPDEKARLAILRDRCMVLPTELGRIDIERIAKEAEGMSGADLKRVVEDAKLGFARDLSRGATPIDLTSYLLRAIETVRANKERYLAAESAARVRNPRRAPYFGIMGGMGDAIAHMQIVESRAD